jgi:alpha-tubulin suppressor-like RCC1 family protein
MNREHHASRLATSFVALSLAASTGMLTSGTAAASLAEPRLSVAPAAAAAGIKAWGENSGGELGNGTATQSNVPGSVANLAAVTSIAAGNRFSLALLPNGTVVAWGSNTYGQLGNGTAADSGVPLPVKGLTNVVAIAAGGGHALALLSNGTVMAWGNNTHGQLGNGSTHGSALPVAVKGLTGVKAIAAGELHSLALLSTGTIVAWGSNQDGQLGNGSFTDSSLPVAVSGLTGVRAISGGGLFSLALLSTTKVASWGAGDAGQLGNGTTSASNVPVAVSNLSGVTAISAGDAHSLALLGNGTAQAWGENAFGQLGNPGPPLSNFSDVPLPVLHLTGAAAVAAGGQYSLALLSGGTVDSWGDNAVGQLGNGTNNDSISPAAVASLSGVSAIAAGASHGLAAVPTAGGSVTGTPLSIFRAIPTPNPFATATNFANVAFTSVSAVTASDAWSVGNSQIGLSQVAFSEHWNGTAWQNVAIQQPAAGRVATLKGVVDLSPGNAWAVGLTADSTNGLERTLIEHWNGAAWSIVPSPNPLMGSTGNDELAAVAGVSANDIWATGEDFSTTGTNGIQLLFAHFDGTSWKAVASPSPPGAFHFANSITTITSNDAWAVGSDEGGNSTTLAAHWNGTRWQIVPTPNLLDGPVPLNRLTGVTAITSTNVLASGYEDNVNQKNFRKPYVLQWNGTTWALANLPNAGTEGARLNGITRVSANDVWAVGQRQENDGAILTYMAKFNGTTWSIVPSPDPGELGPIVDTSLDATSSPGGGVVWALGVQNILGAFGLKTLAIGTRAG